MPRSTALRLTLVLLLPTLAFALVLGGAGLVGARAHPAALSLAAAAAVIVALGLAAAAERRLDCMVAFVRRLAGRDFARPLAGRRTGPLGRIEAALEETREDLGDAFHALEVERERAQGILSAMVEGVVAVTIAGEVILINERAAAIFGLPADVDPRGRHLLELSRVPELQALLRETLATGSVRPLREITVTTAEDRHLAVTVAPVGREPAPGGLVLVFHDVTELKRLEVMRRDFVANVSHELRTPLTAIRGYAETLLSGAAKDRTRAREFLSVIERHAERLGRLIDDLLTLSDVELGRVAVKREPVDLEPMVDDVFTVLAEKAARGDVRLVKDLPADLPAIAGDDDGLHQVLINLADNAVKHTPAGGEVRIGGRATSTATGGFVEVTVADTGIGIPPDHLPRLTERFYRVDKARSRQLGGTGLGLAIVKHIVHAHGGSLDIASTPNVGTTVRLALPAHAHKLSVP